ncbi:MAG: transcriptional regulator, TetR family [Rhodobacteraceae bacterium HLUCCA24]|nr:MAG: transcriptional regulator, TetR family [Rhodobacteraceae bacterium HLUCCA24]
MARTQSKHYPEIRENILKAAAQLFANQGYATTTIEDLSRACTTSRGALYHYFESKEDILFHIIEGHVTAMYASLERALEGLEDPEERLRAIVRTVIAINVTTRAEQIVLLNETNQLKQAEQDSIREQQRRIVGILRRELIRIGSASTMTSDYEKVFTMMFLGMVNYTYVWFDPDGPVSPQEYADLSVDVFLRGFLPKG